MQTDLMLLVVLAIGILIFVWLCLLIVKDRSRYKMELNTSLSTVLENPQVRTGLLENTITGDYQDYRVVLKWLGAGQSFDLYIKILDAGKTGLKYGYNIWGQQYEPKINLPASATAELNDLDLQRLQLCFVEILQQHLIKIRSENISLVLRLMYGWRRPIPSDCELTVRLYLNLVCKILASIH